MSRKNSTEERDYEYIARYISRRYREAKVRLDVSAAPAMVTEPNGMYADDAKYVYYVERCLLECSRSTQLIIRREYLSKPEKDWYISYFSRSTYYRLRAKAAEEFVHCLGY